MRSPRLFWQVYLHGALLIVLIALAVVVTGLLVGRPPAQEAYGRLLQNDLQGLASGEGEMPHLEHELMQRRALLGAAVTVYRTDGSRAGSNVQPPLPPLDPESVAALGAHAEPSPRGRGLVVPIRKGDRLVAYAVVRPPPLLPHLVHAGLALTVVLAAFALGSIPLARRIAAPLEHLTATARRLGEGDLGARTGFAGPGEIGSVGAAFDEMAERLERLVRGQKELLANVSHELRSPLARIRVALELAEEGDAPRAKERLAGIGEDLAELERLVGDVLETARFDLAQIPLRRERVDAGALVAQCAARFRDAHPARALDVDVADALPALDVDPDLLRRALDNLLDNARKFSEDAIALAVRRDGDRVEIAVADRGIGIDPADLARVGTPFFRTDRSRARDTGGVGLGLALARRIAEAHGGSQTVDSAPGEGTTVRIAVPVHAP